MLTISKKAAEKLREQLIHKCFQTGIGFRMLVNSVESGETMFSIKLDRQCQRDKVIDSSGSSYSWTPPALLESVNTSLITMVSLAADLFLRQGREPKLSRISVVQLCQRLKSEVIARGDAYEDYNLRIKILDYFIARNPPDDNFEEALKARLDDPDPAKERSKVICAEILKAWQTRPIDRL